MQSRCTLWMNTTTPLKKLTWNLNMEVWRMFAFPLQHSHAKSSRFPGSYWDVLLELRINEWSDHQAQKVLTPVVAPKTSWNLVSWKFSCCTRIHWSGNLGERRFAGDVQVNTSGKTVPLLGGFASDVMFGWWAPDWKIWSKPPAGVSQLYGCFRK